jgi:hypothetical protein
LAGVVRLSLRLRCPAPVLVGVPAGEPGCDDTADACAQCGRHRRVTPHQQMELDKLRVC